MRRGGDRGFTLIELLIALVVLGVLLSLAIPKYEGIVFKAKTAEAKLQLKTLYDLERAYHLEHDVFTTDMKALGFKQEALITEGGEARYRIAITEAAMGAFSATATCVVDFDEDGAFNTWSITQEGKLVEEVAD